MDMPTALLTLGHLLMFVYWLGGDLGAFYGSSFMTDPKRTVLERTMALKILNNIDMAPRTALIVALPTGLTLAWMKGWVALPGYVPALTAIFCLGWLALAWAVHLDHGGGTGLKRVDIMIRWIMLAMLLALGLGGYFGIIDVPLFIALKLIILAICIGIGLIVRKQLVPLFPPIREMIATGPTPATDAAIAGVIAKTRPMVVTLWFFLLCAAYLGIATPV